MFASLYPLDSFGILPRMHTLWLEWKIRGKNYIVERTEKVERYKAFQNKIYKSYIF